MTILLCFIFVSATSQELTDYEKYRLEKEKEEHPYLYSLAEYEKAVVYSDTSVKRKSAVIEETKDTVYVKQKVKVKVNNYLVDNYPNYSRRIYLDLHFGYYDWYHFSPWYHWDPWYYPWRYNYRWNWYRWDPWYWDSWYWPSYNPFYYPTYRYYSYYGPYYYKTYKSGRNVVKNIYTQPRKNPVVNPTKTTRIDPKYRSMTDRSSITQKAESYNPEGSERKYVPSYQKPRTYRQKTFNKSTPVTRSYTPSKITRAPISRSYNTPTRTSRSYSTAPRSTPSRSYSTPTRSTPTRISTPTRSAPVRSAPARSSSPSRSSRRR